MQFTRFQKANNPRVITASQIKNIVAAQSQAGSLEDKSPLVFQDVEAQIKTWGYGFSNAFAKTSGGAIKGNPLDIEVKASRGMGYTLDMPFIIKTQGISLRILVRYYITKTGGRSMAYGINLLQVFDISENPKPQMPVELYESKGNFIKNNIELYQITLNRVGKYMMDNYNIR